MMAAAMNLDRKGVAPSTPDRPALNPGSRSIAITTGIIGQAMYAPTKTTVPRVKRQPICSAVNSGSAVAMATSSTSPQHGHPCEACGKFGERCAGRCPPPASRTNVSLDLPGTKHLFASAISAKCGNFRLVRDMLIRADVRVLRRLHAPRRARLDRTTGPPRRHKEVG